MYQILVCDDEADIVSALKIYLTSEGYGVLEAHNGKEAVEIVREKEVHLVLLDIMMPELDGISAMIKIRQISNIPVLLLTAKSEDTDKILGLNVGADDYITKPFNPVEVLARVKSNLRRYTELGSAIHNESVLQVGSIVLDNESKSVQVDGEPVALTPTEYDILHLLFQSDGGHQAIAHAHHEETLGGEIHAIIFVQILVAVHPGAAVDVDDDGEHARGLLGAVDIEFVHRVAVREIVEHLDGNARGRGLLRDPQVIVLFRVAADDLRGQLGQKHIFTSPATGTPTHVSCRISRSRMHKQSPAPACP